MRCVEVFRSQLDYAVDHLIWRRLRDRGRSEGIDNSLGNQNGHLYSHENEGSDRQSELFRMQESANEEEVRTVGFKITNRTNYRSCKTPLHYKNADSAKRSGYRKSRKKIRSNNDNFESSEDLTTESTNIVPLSDQKYDQINNCAELANNKRCSRENRLNIAYSESSVDDSSGAESALSSLYNDPIYPANKPYNMTKGSQNRYADTDQTVEIDHKFHEKLQDEISTTNVERHKTINARNCSSSADYSSKEKICEKKTDYFESACICSEHLEEISCHCFRSPSRSSDWSCGQQEKAKNPRSSRKCRDTKQVGSIKRPVTNRNVNKGQPSPNISYIAKEKGNFKKTCKFSQNNKYKHCFCPKLNNKTLVSMIAGRQRQPKKKTRSYMRKSYIINGYVAKQTQIYICPGNNKGMRSNCICENQCSSLSTPSKNSKNKNQQPKRDYIEAENDCICTGKQDQYHCPCCLCEGQPKESKCEKSSRLDETSESEQDTKDSEANEFGKKATAIELSKNCTCSESSSNCICEHEDHKPSTCLRKSHDTIKQPNNKSRRSTSHKNSRICYRKEDSFNYPWCECESDAQTSDERKESQGNHRDETSDETRINQSNRKVTGAVEENICVCPSMPICISVEKQESSSSFCECNHSQESFNSTKDAKKSKHSEEIFSQKIDSIGSFETIVSQDICLCSNQDEQTSQSSCICSSSVSSSKPDRTNKTSRQPSEKSRDSTCDCSSDVLYTYKKNEIDASELSFEAKKKKIDLVGVNGDTFIQNSAKSISTFLKTGESSASLPKRVTGPSFTKHGESHATMPRLETNLVTLSKTDENVGISLKHRSVSTFSKPSEIHSGSQKQENSPSILTKSDIVPAPTVNQEKSPTSNLKPGEIRSGSPQRGSSLLTPSKSHIVPPQKTKREKSSSIISKRDGSRPGSPKRERSQSPLSKSDIVPASTPKREKSPSSISKSDEIRSGSPKRIRSSSLLSKSDIVHSPTSKREKSPSSISKSDEIRSGSPKQERKFFTLSKSNIVSGSTLERDKSPSTISKLDQSRSGSPKPGKSISKLSKFDIMLVPTPKQEKRPSSVSKSNEIYFETPKRELKLSTSAKLDIVSTPTPKRVKYPSELVEIRSGSPQREKKSYPLSKSDIVPASTPKREENLSIISKSDEIDSGSPKRGSSSSRFSKSDIVPALIPKRERSLTVISKLAESSSGSPRRERSHSTISKSDTAHASTPKQEKSPWSISKPYIVPPQKTKREKSPSIISKRDKSLSGSPKQKRSLSPLLKSDTIPASTPKREKSTSSISKSDEIRSGSPKRLKSASNFDKIPSSTPKREENAPIIPKQVEIRSGSPQEGGSVSKFLKTDIITTPTTNHENRPPQFSKPDEHRSESLKYGRSPLIISNLGESRSGSSKLKKSPSTFSKSDMTISASETNLEKNPSVILKPDESHFGSPKRDRSPSTLSKSDIVPPLSMKRDENHLIISKRGESRTGAPKHILSTLPNTDVALAPAPTREENSSTFPQITEKYAQQEQQPSNQQENERSPLKSPSTGKPFTSNFSGGHKTADIYEEKSNHSETEFHGTNLTTSLGKRKSSTEDENKRESLFASSTRNNSPNRSIKNKRSTETSNIVRQKSKGDEKLNKNIDKPIASTIVVEPLEEDLQLFKKVSVEKISEEIEEKDNELNKMPSGKLDSSETHLNQRSNMQKVYKTEQRETSRTNIFLQNTPENFPINKRPSSVFKNGIRSQPENLLSKKASTHSERPFPAHNMPFQYTKDTRKDSSEMLNKSPSEKPRSQPRNDGKSHSEAPSNPENTTNVLPSRVPTERKAKEGMAVTDSAMRLVRECENKLLECQADNEQLNFEWENTKTHIQTLEKDLAICRKNYEDCLSSKTNENNALQQMLTLQRENETLNQELNVMKVTVNQLEMQNNVLTERNGKLYSELPQYDAEAQNLAVSCLPYIEKIGFLETKIVNLTNQNADNLQEYLDCKAKLDTCHDDLSKCIKQLTEGLHEELEEIPKPNSVDCREWIELVDKQEAKLKEFKFRTAKSALLATISAKQRNAMQFELSELKDALKKSQEDSRKFLTDYAGSPLQSQIDSLIKEIQTHEYTIEKYAALNSRLEKEKQEAIEDVARMQNRLEKCEEEIEKVATGGESYISEQYAKLRKENNALIADVDSKKRDIERLNADLSWCNSHWKTLQSKLDDSDTKLNNLPKYSLKGPLEYSEISNLKEYEKTDHEIKPNVQGYSKRNPSTEMKMEIKNHMRDVELMKKLYQVLQSELQKIIHKLNTRPCCANMQDELTRIYHAINWMKTRICRCYPDPRELNFTPECVKGTDPILHDISLQTVVAGAHSLNLKQLIYLFCTVYKAGIDLTKTNCRCCQYFERATDIKKRKRKEKDYKIDKLKLLEMEIEKTKKLLCNLKKCNKVKSNLVNCRNFLFK